MLLYLILVYKAHWASNTGVDYSNIECDDDNNDDDDYYYQISLFHKPGEGQNIVLHALPIATDSTLQISAFSVHLSAPF